MTRALSIALQFLTRFPVRLDRAPSPQDTGVSLLWYPAAGVLIGLGLVGIFFVTAGVPILARSCLLLTVWVAITGGMHLDGLADTVDGWVGGQGDPKRTLEIMRDPRSGPAGVTAIVLVLLMKFSALSTLLQEESAAMTALVMTPVLGRVGIMALILSTPYARPSGLGVLIARHAPRRTAAFVALASCSAVIIFAGVAGAIAVSSVTGVYAWRWWAMRRIGGWTGDVAGFVLEFSETSVLLISSVVYS